MTTRTLTRTINRTHLGLAATDRKPLSAGMLGALEAAFAQDIAQGAGVTGPLNSEDRRKAVLS
ncbi:MAG: hypothetical protein H0T69_02410 [Thermoleophilaceae bacterium]|nr:hypothetical protein [Thermoleophilaceae bacterium]